MSDPIPTPEHVLQMQAALTADYVVAGKPGEQFGLKHVKFSCPYCFVPSALSGPGKFVCSCGKVLDVKGG